MKQQFSVEEAIEYCKKKKANVLMSDINWLEEDAVFKLLNISKNLLMYYLEDSVEDEDHNFITPNGLLARNIKTVWLDTSEVEKVSGKYRALF